MGKNPGASPEELEFIFQCFQRGLSDREVLDEMQDEEFPLRNPRFIRDRRREFNAAKKVLQNHIESEKDPLIIEARRKHTEALNEFISRWQVGLQKVHGRVLRFIREIWESNWQEHIWISELKVFDFTFVPKNERVSKPFIAITPKFESDELFYALKSHLSSSRYEPFWAVWQELKQDLVKNIGHRLIEITEKEYVDWENEESAIAMEVQWDCDVFHKYLESIRLKGIFPGHCPFCPEQALAESSKNVSVKLDEFTHGMPNILPKTERFYFDI